MDKTTSTITDINTIPQGESTKKPLIKQVPNPIKDCVCSVIKELKLQNDVYYEEVEHFTNKVLKSFTVYGRICKASENDYTALQIQLYERLTTLLGKSYVEKNFDMLWKVTCGAKQGEQYYPIEVFDADLQKVLLPHDDGKFLIVYFWNSTNKESQKALEESFESYSKNKSFFKDNDIILCSIGSEDNYPTWRKYLKEKNWDMGNQFFKADCKERLGISELPFCMIVNKSSKIEYAGDPNKLSLKETVMNLISGKGVKLVVEVNDKIDRESNLFFFGVEGLKRKEMIDKANSYLISSKLNKVKFSVVIIRTFTMKGIRKVVYPSFTGIIIPEDLDKVKEVSKKLETGFGFTNFNFNLELYDVSSNTNNNNKQN